MNSETRESSQLPDNNISPLRSYPGRWKGRLLIVCRKCRRKLRRREADQQVLRLKKSLKRLARQDKEGIRFHVIEVPCLKMCPKGGVTVCTQGQIGLGECSIVRSCADADALYALCKSEAALNR